MKQRIFVTGYGMITSIGNNAAENLQSLRSNITGYGHFDILETSHKGKLKGCEIKYTDQPLREWLGLPDGKSNSRTTLLGLIAAKEAIQSAQLSERELRTAALISATTTGGIRELENDYLNLQDHSKHGNFEQYAITSNPGDHTERIADYFSIKGFVNTISTACSSSANALMLGANLIQHGNIDVAICGGAEVLSKFTVNGFNSLMILDQEHCRPFDKARNGLNLGEGAAYVVLESEEAVMRGNKKIIAELKGFGNANDAFHQTASSPDGAGAFQAMSLALQSAVVTPSDIQYINAHGTGTENNDLSEGLAIQRLFGEHVPPFSSTKPFTGHTLAAAGAIEAIYSLMALQHDVIFPNLNFNVPMDELFIRPVINNIQSLGLKNILSNSFGFGGNTSSLLFGLA
jgi:3-oxoacyl-(acyl-carrier-protein) synthase